jgi:hypothetical protein
VLAEDKNTFIELLKDKNLADAKTIQCIDQLNTNMLLQTIDNPAVIAALNGEQGETHYIKYTDKSVFASYLPLEFLGQRWAFVAEID